MQVFCHFVSMLSQRLVSTKLSKQQDQIIDLAEIIQFSTSVNIINFLIFGLTTISLDWVVLIFSLSAEQKSAHSSWIIPSILNLLPMPMLVKVTTKNFLFSFQTFPWLNEIPFMLVESKTSRSRVAKRPAWWSLSVKSWRKLMWKWKDWPSHIL